jgi:hypothetical protein
LLLEEANCFTDSEAESDTLLVAGTSETSPSIGSQSMSPPSVPTAYITLVDGEDFSYLSHITHIDSACDIIRDWQIKPFLTKDNDCVLKQMGIPVVWLSPDLFYEQGSNFGNVEFRIPVDRMFQGKRFYQLSNDEYKGAGKDFRCFLITNRAYPSPLCLYDPGTSEYPWNGPSLTQSGRSYSSYGKGNNERVTFLMDESICIDYVSDLRTVDHRPDWCLRTKESGSRFCHDIGRSSAKAKVSFFCSVVSQQVHNSLHFFTTQGEGNTRAPTWPAPQKVVHVL